MAVFRDSALGTRLYLVDLPRSGIPAGLRLFWEEPRVNVPLSWPRMNVPMCPLHEVDVPLAHVPDHTWLGMSEGEWTVNLEMYATHPERFLQLQCEGECWCNPPDARSNSWAGHGRGPTACRFETRPFDERLARAVVVARQSQAAGANLAIDDPMLMLEVVAALAHHPGWCACLPSMLTRLDEVPEYLSRGWTFETFPGREPAIATVRTWINPSFPPGKGLFVSGGVGRGKTGLAAATMRQFLAVDPARTAFFGRLTMVREELSGETGAVLAAWLGAVDLLILDDLDFGWGWTNDGNRGSVSLAQCLRTRLSQGRRVLMTAHVLPSELAEDVDPSVRAVFVDSPWLVAAVSEGPSLRTGRTW
ncbi:MAG: hypothetical protein NVSMB2_03400 [Chloroflexota bacterium]